MRAIHARWGLRCPAVRWRCERGPTGAACSHGRLAFKFQARLGNRRHRVPPANQVAGEPFRQTSRGDADNRRNASPFSGAPLASFDGAVRR